MGEIFKVLLIVKLAYCSKLKIKSKVNENLPCCSSRSELKMTSILKFGEPMEPKTLFIFFGFEVRKLKKKLFRKRKPVTIKHSSFLTYVLSAESAGISSAAVEFPAIFLRAQNHFAQR